MSAMFLGLDTSHLWLIIGALLLAVEAFGVPGIGFLFAGLSAITVGLLVNFSVFMEQDYVPQIGAFFMLTAVSAIVLWKKLKQWHTAPGKGGEYQNIIGDKAIVGRGGLRKGHTGQVSWSGTTMMAEIDDTTSLDAIKEGAVVKIVAVRGSKLIVAP